MRNSSSSQSVVGRAMRKFGFPLILVTAIMLFSVSQGLAAPASCASTSVASQADLDAAIAAFNAETRACRHKITLTADITLETPMTGINNNHDISHARLVIAGNHFSVEAPDDDTSIFSIGPKTHVIMEQIIISGARTNYDGAGIRNAGHLVLRKSTVSDNQGLYGGGIYNSGKLRLFRSSISDNWSDEEGAGIYNEGNLTVIRSNIINNNTSGPSPGGGIYNTGRLTVSYSTISNNGAVEEGGGIDNEGGTVIINNSTLDHNEAGLWGGGISNFRGKVFITNSTLSANKGYSHGGGGIGNSGTLTLTNSTLSKNSSEEDGVGGIDNTGKLTLKNSIIANSKGGDCDNRYGDTMAAFFSLIEDSGEDACSLINGVRGNIIGVDPRLGKLKKNGGPTKTHALLKRSRAINRGKNKLAVDVDGKRLKTDQRGKGHRRIFRKRVDIGAYEFSNRKLR